MEIHEVYKTRPPIFDYETNTLKIPMKNRFGEFTAYSLAEINDAAFLLQYCYSKHVMRKNMWYAFCAIMKTNMHQMLLGEAPPGMMIDHKNGDKLDNRRSNLRFATAAQNSQNRPKKEGCSSEYIGVSLSRTGKWEVYAMHEKKRIYISCYDDEEYAALVYDVYSIHSYGADARINGFLDESEIAWIVRNGIPDEFKKKEKPGRVARNADMPKCIRANKAGTFTVQKKHNGSVHIGTFPTLDKAQKWLEELEEGWKKEEQAKKDARVVTKNAGGLAFLTDKKGNEILVDEELWLELEETIWNQNDDGYTLTTKIEETGETSMHRHVWRKVKGPIPEGMTIDHINGNRSDNRICNLRLADASLQGHNKEKIDSPIEKYRCVTFNGTKFMVMMLAKFIASYDTAEDAAKRANEEFVLLYGKNAKLNEIDWTKRTTKDNRITLDMINRPFVESLTTKVDIKNLIVVLHLDKQHGGNISLRKFKSKHIKPFKEWLLKTYFSDEQKEEDLTEQEHNNNV